MNPSYLRIKVPMATALERFRDWIGLEELGPPETVSANRVLERGSNATGQWSGVAVFVHEASCWTVFDDLTGYLTSITASRWAELAGDEELVFAGYNDAVPYGQIIAVREGRIIRDFLEDLQQPAQNVNMGRLDMERASLIDNWIAAASFVDEDELADAGVESGLLWLFRSPT